jgi:hypothetical protein
MHLSMIARVGMIFCNKAATHKSRYPVPPLRNSKPAGSLPAGSFLQEFRSCRVSQRKINDLIEQIVAVACLGNHFKILNALAY